jgi:hypothetical protein
VSEVSVPLVPCAALEVMSHRTDDTFDDVGVYAGESRGGSPGLGVEDPPGWAQNDPSIQSGVWREISRVSMSVRPPSQPAIRSIAGKDPPIQLGDLREVTDVYHG